ncbi:MAG: hypothetical protein GY747_08850 [Planctomycetes bacterium]|nr:hypothetical protein [Planctomycetota bacterium]MCP4771295.1 hypothetical protein [Planctomycetota bacterium]MCP4860472.1 hypothetical protein [Planctomycetota bacterium]
MNISASRLLIAASVFAAPLFLTSAATAQQASTEASPWDFYGDFRWHVEMNDRAPGTVDHHRERIRFRAGANYRFNEEVTAGVRLITGNPDYPNSSHQDLGRVFDSFQLSLDRLFFHYTPTDMPYFTATGGKFNNPVFRNPLFADAVWDLDLQPEGLALNWKWDDVGEIDRLEFLFAEYALLEQSNSSDAWTSVAGLRVRKETGKDGLLEFSSNYTFFGDQTPGGSGVILADYRGNAMNGTELASDFHILDKILAFYTGDLTFSAEMINNLSAADGVGDSGFSLGAGMDTDLGKFYYSFTTMEQDAIMTLVSQDDTLLPTNYKTHVVGWREGFGDGMVVQLYTLISEPKEMLAGYTDDTVYRIRFDATFNF